NSAPAMPEASAKYFARSLRRRVQPSRAADNAAGARATLCRASFRPHQTARLWSPKCFDPVQENKSWLQQFKRVLREPLHADAVMSKDISLTARHRIFIRDAHDFEAAIHARLRHDAGAGLTESTVNHVLFDRDDGAARAGALQ